MTPDAITKFIVNVGVLPAIIAALMYLLYKSIGDVSKAQGRFYSALDKNTTALARLIEYVRGRNNE